MDRVCRGWRLVQAAGVAVGMLGPDAELQQGLTGHLVTFSPPATACSSSFPLAVCVWQNSKQVYQHNRFHSAGSALPGGVMLMVWQEFDLCVMESTWDMVKKTCVKPSGPPQFHA